MIRSGVAGIALIACLVGCDARPPATDGGAPDEPVATAVLRAGEIRIADRTEIEIRVATAPGWRLRRPEPPASLPGFEILESRTLPVVRDAEREIHRHALQLRALDVGDFVWPALSLEVVGPDGTAIVRSTPPIPLHVGSVMDEHPGRREPFGARSAPPPHSARRGSPGALAATGAAVAIALIALLAVSRRRSRSTAPAKPAPTPPWSAALHALDGATADTLDPIEAGHHAAIALRSYVDRRFGARTLRSTSEEVAAATPPYAATSSWPTLVELLRDLDTLRFRPTTSITAPQRRAALESTLVRARAFVDATTPPEGLR